MEVKEFQKSIIEFINQWNTVRHVVPNEKSAFIHLVEEVGELATQYVNKEKRPHKYSEKELENAIGDIFLQVVGLAHIHGYDIEEVVMKIMKEDQPRLK